MRIEFGTSGIIDVEVSRYDGRVRVLIHGYGRNAEISFELLPEEAKKFAEAMDLISSQVNDIY